MNDHPIGRKSHDFEEQEECQQVIGHQRPYRRNVSYHHKEVETFLVLLIAQFIKTEERCYGEHD
jgi:hypothetical protein